MTKAVCAACRHAIDDAAKICPYCGSDPHTGEKLIDTQAMLQEVFHRREHVSKTEELLHFARQRQGIVIALGVIVVIALLAIFHQFVMQRNAKAVSGAPAVPLTDIADLSDQAQENQPLSMPELKFQYDGNPKTMRSFIVEPGAVPPPEVQSGESPLAALAQVRGTSAPVMPHRAAPPINAEGQAAPATAGQPPAALSTSPAAPVQRRTVPQYTPALPQPSSTQPSSAAPPPPLQQ